VKKAVRWLVVAVAVAWLVQDPAGAAALAHRAVLAVSHAAHALSVLASGL
jgi:hypothetical protein